MNPPRLIFAGMLFALLFVLVSASPVSALDINGRIAVSGSLAHPSGGDAVLGNDDWVTTDQESLRLLLGDSGDNTEWSLHAKVIRQHLQGVPAPGSHSSDYFRYQALSANWLNKQDADSSSYIGAELDRAAVKQSFGKFVLTVGRQPIDWGSGRFWQPLNVLGAFAPTDLDTEYKPGIDALKLNVFPSEFATLTAAYVFSPHADPTSKNSAVVHYKRLVGEQSELAVLAGEVSGDRVAGASFESEVGGVGVRLEATHHALAADSSNPSDKAWFIIAGADYKFENGLTLTTELYNNHFGASRVSELEGVQNGWLLRRGLQPHLSRNVLGVALQKELSPLLNGSYTLLGSQLDGNEGGRTYSFLHQLNLNYSLSDESDVILSLQNGSGAGLSPQGRVQSEFGHVSPSITVRWSQYF